MDVFFLKHPKALIGRVSRFNSIYRTVDHFQLCTFISWSLFFFISFVFFFYCKPISHFIFKEQNRGGHFIKNKKNQTSFQCSLDQIEAPPFPHDKLMYPSHFNPLLRNPPKFANKKKTRQDLLRFRLSSFCHLERKNPSNETNHFGFSFRFWRKFFSA